MSTLLERLVPTEAGETADAEAEERLRIAAAPHIKSPETTTRIMWTVVASMIPIVMAAA